MGKVSERERIATLEAKLKLLNVGTETCGTSRRKPIHGACGKNFLFFHAPVRKLASPLVCAGHGRIERNSICPTSTEYLMPKVNERERIQALEQKLKQLKVLQQRKEAKARNVALHRTRREEMRRKFLVGAIILAKVEAGEIEEATLKQWLRPALTKVEDRQLFGLDSKG